MENYKIENLYSGGYSSIDPNKSLFSGYRADVGKLSISTNPQTAAVAKEFSEKLNLGLKNIEVEALIPKVFDAMPTEQLKEIDRLAKLTGTKVSMHGVVVEPSGVSQQGYSEGERLAVERQIKQNLIRAHDANPNGITVNFHTSNMLPSENISKIKDKDGKEITIQNNVLYMDTESGKVGILPIKERSFPGDEKISPKSEIDLANEERWSQGIKHLAYYSDAGKDMLDKFGPSSIAAKMRKESGIDLGEEEKMSQIQVSKAYSFMNDSYREMKEMYNQADRNAKRVGNEKQKEMLNQFAEQVREKAEEIKKEGESEHGIFLRKQIIDQGIELFEKIAKEGGAPRSIEMANDFMMEKSAETFGNATFDAYKHFKEKGLEKEAPITIIENPPANQQFSNGQELADMVKKSREVFVNKAVEEGMSKSQAEKTAERLIGATLDVGHLNMLRQKGYSDEDIANEAEKVAPYLKHVHLSDNFGMEHTELPMGMGNVPFKQIMDKLGQKGYEATKVIEAGDWWTQHTPKGGGTPLGPSLEGMGSPMYSGGAGPYWNQAMSLTQGYFGGFGMMLPQTNYNMFGAGFSQLPMELGGNLPQIGSRTSGRPME